MSNTATRLITLMMLLQRQAGQKASDLASELGVSTRTIHRYLNMLEEMGIPVYSERGPHGGFSLVRGYKMPPLVFSPEEAVAVSLGTNLVEEMWGSLYRMAARSALAKLESVLPDEQRREAAWARRTLHTSGLHRADLDALSPLLEVLRKACRDLVKVNISYMRSGQVESTERIIHPYAMLHRWGWWYVVAYCQLRQAVRTFRVDRIQALVPLQETFHCQPDFDLATFLGSEPAQPAAVVKMRFLPKFASVAYENRTAWEEMVSNADGSVDVCYAAPDLHWAVSMALGYGPIVEILEPQEARSIMVEWSKQISNLYHEVSNGEN